MKGIYVDQTQTNPTRKIYHLAVQTLSYLDSATKLAGKSATVRKDALYKSIGELQALGDQVFLMLKTMGFIQIHEYYITRTEKQSPWGSKLDASHTNEESNVIKENKTIQKAAWVSPTKAESAFINNQYLILMHASNSDRIMVSESNLSTARDLVKGGLLNKINQNVFSITKYGKDIISNITLEDKLTKTGAIFFCMAENSVIEGDKHKVYINNFQILKHTNKSTKIGAQLEKLENMGLFNAQERCLTDKGCHIFREVKEKYAIESDEYRLIDWAQSEPDISLERLNKVYDPTFLVLQVMVNNVVNANGKYLVAYNRETLAAQVGKVRTYVQRYVDTLVDAGCIERSGRNKLYVLQKGIDIIAESKRYIREGIPNNQIFSNYFSTILFMLQHTTNCYDYKMIQDYIPKDYQKSLQALINDGIIMKVGTHYCFTKEGYQYALAAKVALKV